MPLKQFEEEANVHVPTYLDLLKARLHHYLSQAVRRRGVIHAPIPFGKDNQASIALLFSGGVDSIVLAALCHDHVPLDQLIDLINVELQLSIPHWNCLRRMIQNWTARIRFHFLRIIGRLLYCPFEKCNLVGRIVIGDSLLRTWIIQNC